MSDLRTIREELAAQVAYITVDGNTPAGYAYVQSNPEPFAISVVAVTSDELNSSNTENKAQVHMLVEIGPGSSLEEAQMLLDDTVQAFVARLKSAEGRASLGESALLTDVVPVSFGSFGPREVGGSKYVAGEISIDVAYVAG